MQASQALSLLNAKAVRERAHMLLELGLQGELEHFAIDLSHLAEAARRTLAATDNSYPDRQIPFHARWRHFEAGGIDRWVMLAGARRFSDVQGMGRAACDLAIVSALMNAAAGEQWSYREAITGETYKYSEGLAIGSLSMFSAGFFSDDPLDPLRADAITLFRLDEDELIEGLQVTDENQLIGLKGRLGLLNNLGQATTLRPDLFSKKEEPRPGGLFDVLYEEGQKGPLPAERILEVVLDGLGPIWPNREEIDGVIMGDTWRHSKVVTKDKTDNLVPFHQLSQWIAYSLVEPLSWAGVELENIDGLTGLAEYRNGGLFMDTGVLRLKDPSQAYNRHEVSSELIVEWRALTIALLDKLAEWIRTDLEVTSDQLPLACVLEGGSSAAGRQIALEKRRDGSPPLMIISDGTVF